MNNHVILLLKLKKLKFSDIKCTLSSKCFLFWFYLFWDKLQDKLELCINMPFMRLNFPELSYFAVSIIIILNIISKKLGSTINSSNSIYNI